MSEPRVRYEVTPGDSQRQQPARVVRVLLPLDLAQAVTRLQQLRNQGYLLSQMRLMEDEQGRIRVEPDA